ncbi:MAG: DUF58 domain-containing protein [Siculibacillus sp.]|nr:DUF58 domain-containing protein [Siculibacillus sp.]
MATPVAQFAARLASGLGAATRTADAAPVDRARLVAARSLAEAMPDLLVEARRVAATVASGWHGRRRAGSGEAFWQYRPLVGGEAASAIDWRRSARDDQLYVREREWEAAHTVWLAPDLSPSMDWRSDFAPVTKRDRAVVLTLALADLLGRAGERVGMPGVMRPITHRRVAERLAAALAVHTERLAFPTADGLDRFCELVVIGDFLDEFAALETRLAALAGSGARLHLARVVDPAEAALPYLGHLEFRDPESDEIVRVPRTEALKGAWERRWTAHGAALADLARRGGWTLITHATDRAAVEAALALSASLGGERHGLPVGRPAGGTP